MDIQKGFIKFRIVLKRTSGTEHHIEFITTETSESRRHGQKIRSFIPASTSTKLKVRFSK